MEDDLDEKFWNWIHSGEPSAEDYRYANDMMSPKETQKYLHGRFGGNVVVCPMYERRGFFTRRIVH